ncbi:MAG: hypothetical protein VW547_02010 [Alphaproteobacteria bacterium]
MPGRYDKTYDLDIKGAFGQKEPPAPTRKQDPWAKMLELAGMAAPAVGTGAGALIGGAIGSAAGGIGAVPGAAIGSAVGNAAGQGLGALATGGAQELNRDNDEEYEGELRAQEERRARQQAALGLLGGM